MHYSVRVKAYTCHQFAQRRLSLFTRKKKKILEELWTVLFPISTFKPLVISFYNCAVLQAQCNACISWLQKREAKYNVSAQSVEHQLAKLAKKSNSAPVKILALVEQKPLDPMQILFLRNMVRTSVLENCACAKETPRQQYLWDRKSVV